jgi:hypothetical protein
MSKTKQADSQPPKIGIARTLYELGRDNPERVDKLFEAAKSDREASHDE